MSLSIDLGLGQPMEHMLRSCVLALRIADHIGVTELGKKRIFYANLLAWIGCHADSSELAALFTDDIAFRADYYLIDAHGLPMLSLMLRHAAMGARPLPRTGNRVRFALESARTVRSLITSHCNSAGALAGRVGLDAGTASMLACTFERWDGAGLPLGLRGSAIPLEMRITQLADTAEVFLRTAGFTATVDMVSRRGGTQFDPSLAELFCSNALVLTEGLFELDPWVAALHAAPTEWPMGEDELDSLLRAIGDFADLKSPGAAGHSRNVATLVSSAAGLLGLSTEQTVILRRAAWTHDIGRMGVSNKIWDATAPLSTVDTEHLHRYPELSERILSRIPGLRDAARIAGAHRERLDGSGYPRGLGGEELTGPQRLLAVADAYQGMLEPRRHRPAFTPVEATSRITEIATRGLLDANCVDAVLMAAGQPVSRPAPGVAGLTPRELQVLRLACRGLSGREVAEYLRISPKTARNHVEHIYTKTGATNRVELTLYALDQRLLDRDGS